LNYGIQKAEREAVATFLEGNGTFIYLPTGYRKSLIYAVDHCIWQVER